MKWTPDETKRVIARLNQLMPDMRCPLCRTDDWIVANGLVFLRVEEYTDALSRGLTRGRASEMPCTAITCKVCGNTQLLNLIQIGLGDLLKD